MVSYQRIGLGTANVYLVPGEAGYLLVDAGMPRKAKAFFRYIEQRFINPEEIKLIVITHAHFDHTGSLCAIRKRCGCPVAIHEKEALLLRQGRTEIPAGTNRLSNAFCSWAKTKWFVDRLVRYAPVEPDILVTEEMSLAPYGFSASLVPTPGHTSGSISLLTRKGEAFVGDLASNNYPLGRGPIYNPIGEDGPLMLESLAEILKKGANVFLPGHGPPFSAERLEAFLEKKREKSCFHRLWNSNRQRYGS